MSSLTFAGVWFSCYSDDHMPPHVHGKYGGVTVIVELIDGHVRLAKRSKAISPPNGKRSDVKRILQTATENADALHNLWRRVHG
jgi:hypothetical protein